MPRRRCRPAPISWCIPGGFSYGDYLRCGAIAARAPIMDAVRAFAARGGLVLGGLQRFPDRLRGRAAARRADAQCAAPKFICRDVYLRVERSDTPFTRGYNAGQVIRVPVAHGEGNYIADGETIARLEGEGRVLFRYAAPDGMRRPGLEPQRLDQRHRRHHQRARQRARPDAASGEPRRSRAGPRPTGVACSPGWWSISKWPR